MAMGRAVTPLSLFSSCFISARSPLPLPFFAVRCAQPVVRLYECALFFSLAGSVGTSSDGAPPAECVCLVGVQTGGSFREVPVPCVFYVKGSRPLPREVLQCGRSSSSARSCRCNRHGEVDRPRRGMTGGTKSRFGIYRHYPLPASQSARHKA